MPAYEVAFEVRRQGAIGAFEWLRRTVEAETDTEARKRVFADLHAEGYETRGGYVARQATLRECTIAVTLRERTGSERLGTVPHRWEALAVGRLTGGHVEHTATEAGPTVPEAIARAAYAVAASMYGLTPVARE